MVEAGNLSFRAETLRYSCEHRSSPGFPPGELRFEINHSHLFNFFFQYDQLAYSLQIVFKKKHLKEMCGPSIK